jgi:NADPH:quinone reductase-like Zn-dependent oxidoreductase
MARAVKFETYGGIDVLEVVEVEQPVPGPGEVVVRVKATSINPGEAKIREGLLHARWPATFPSGEGSDLAGTIEAVGDGVTGFAAGDDVLGFTDDRSSHADSVQVPVNQLVRRPPGVPWPVAGSLHVAGTTAYAAVRAVHPGPGEVIVVAGAAGGVGSIAVQLAKRTGATVIGLASAANHAWLAGHGVIPLAYAEPDLAIRIRAAAAGRIDAFIDTVGYGYVNLALDLGVAPDRIDTIVEFGAAAEHGVKTEGNSAGATADVLAELAKLVVAGELEVPIASTYPLDRVKDAFRELESGHVHGKIVLEP